MIFELEFLDIRYRSSASAIDNKIKIDNKIEIFFLAYSFNSKVNFFPIPKFPSSLCQ